MKIVCDKKYNLLPGSLKLVSHAELFNFIKEWVINVCHPFEIRVNNKSV